MTTANKNCACPSPEVINVPGVQGSTGANGSDGSNGINSYTVTTANITIPATNSSVSVSVAVIGWMAVGQFIFISDGTNLMHGQVTGLQVTPPVATVKALGNNGDSAATTVIATGATVTPAGVQGVASFTPVATNSSANAGSQNVSASSVQALASTLTLSGSAGKTYLLFARLRLDYVGATFAAARTVTLTVRRTNNTPADVATRTIQTAVVTTVTYGAGEVTIVIPYTTVGASDTIQPYVSIDVIPTAGNLNVVESSIAALQLT